MGHRNYQAFCLDNKRSHWFYKKVNYLCLGYVPKTVKKGEDEYVVIVQGVQDTGKWDYGSVLLSLIGVYNIQFNRIICKVNIL